ncbi:hypothetical protein DEW08_27075 (plasmid) [Azospirillum thermophilum]|uniref:Uncharacterized protein n=1 Tax=Azospirillum thermophilum TaxID=2202148 RepID=A0A2S2CYR0_9PROT|nr:hypothetical protein DEW08_27075 [Azospirillum thermophilum]
MAGFLLKRLIQAIFVVMVVTLVVSFAIRLTGDPALMLTQGRAASPNRIWNASARRWASTSPSWSSTGSS